MRYKRKRSAQESRGTTSTSIVPGELGVGEATPDATVEGAGVGIPKVLPVVE